MFCAGSLCSKAVAFALLLYLLLVRLRCLPHQVNLCLVTADEGKLLLQGESRSELVTSSPGGRLSPSLASPSSSNPSTTRTNPACCLNIYFMKDIKPIKPARVLVINSNYFVNASSIWNKLPENSYCLTVWPRFFPASKLTKTLKQKQINLSWKIKKSKNQGLQKK